MICDDFVEICVRADAAGRAAVANVVTQSVRVFQETYPFSGEMDTSRPSYVLDDFPCGFAWVDVYPEFKGNTILGKAERRILESAGFSKSYTGKAYQKWISDFNQSMQKKEAYARKFAEVLQDNGITAYCGSRMD